MNKIEESFLSTSHSQRMYEKESRIRANENDIESFYPSMLESVKI